MEMKTVLNWILLGGLFISGVSSAAGPGCNEKNGILSSEASNAINLALNAYSKDMPAVKNFRIAYSIGDDDIEVTMLVVKLPSDPVYGGSLGRWSITYIFDREGRYIKEKIYNK